LIRPLFKNLILLTVVLCGTLTCAKKTGTFYAGSLGLQDDRIIIASQLASVLTISMFDMEGNFIKTLADYQGEANGPRGLALYDSQHVVVSLEGDDRLDLVSLSGDRTNFIQSSFFTGTIGRVYRHDESGSFFIIENTNMIERFSFDGSRVPVTGNPFVNGALAPCAAPATLRALAVNNSGNILAVQSGATTGFRYTIGATVASACAAVAALPSAANDLINHSDGNMYFIGTNSQVYRASQTLTGSTSIFNNTGIISTYTAMAELPNGDLLIA